MSTQAHAEHVPAISVLMPCYNAERFLPEAIQSILDQTFTDFEFVIVDDGSTDNTRNVVRMYAERDARIRLIENDHGGISGALNRGIQECRGEWIARMDGDDVALPQRLQRQITAARANPRIVVWGAYAYHVNCKGETLGISRTGPTSEQHFQALRRAGGEVHVIHPTAMLHRQTLLSVGCYDAAYNGCEDFELFDRMSERGPVVAIPEPLLRYRIHSSSVSMKKFFTMRRLASYVIERHKLRLKNETLTLGRYLDQESHQPVTAKMAWWIFHYSGFCYRKAGLYYGEGRMTHAVAYFGISTLLNPRYALWRMWNQLFSKQARRLRGRTPSEAPVVGLERFEMVNPKPSTVSVTILMPAYNAERHIAAAIESVLAQSHTAFELLVIDDGSKDRTFEIAKSFAARDGRVRAVTQKNSGIAHTMNRGIEMSTGNWLFCMHADDLMMPNRLERQLAFIEKNPDVSVVSSLVHYINDAGEIVGTGRSPFTDPAVVERTVDNGEVLAFNHPATAMRLSAVIMAGGYRQEFWPAEDIDLWSRVVECGYRVAVQDEILLKYRIHGSSASIAKARLMQQKALWMERCVACRRNDTPEPTWEQFKAARANAPLLTRVHNWRREVGRTLYQSAMHQYATRNWLRFLPALAVAAALEPSLVMSRVLPRLRPRFLKPAQGTPQSRTSALGTLA